MILQFTKKGKGSLDAEEIIEESSDRAVKISKLDDELASAVRKKQSMVDEAKKVACDSNSTLPMLLDSQIRLIKEQQRITTLVLLQLVTVFDIKEEINLDELEKLLQ